MPSPQNRYFIVTASYAKARCDSQGRLRLNPWTPNTFYADNDDVIWVMGQEEHGGVDGYHHYQFIFSTKKKVTLTKARSYFPCHLSPHIEPTRSEAAEEYCRKNDTRVPDSEFELGVNLDEYIAHR